MTHQIAYVAGMAICAASASAQLNSNLGAAHSIVTTMQASEPAGHVAVRGPILASLTYDGSSSWGFMGQDFESLFDLYDTFCAETFSIATDSNLTEFRATGFGTGNPFAITDFIVEIYPASDLANICDDSSLPEPLLTSFPGIGFFDGVDAVTDFDGQHIPAGNYVLRYAAQLEFAVNGQFFFFAQAGEHDNAGGTANDGFLSNPGVGFGSSHCFPTIDGGTGLNTGVNFILCGTPSPCDNACPDPNSCGDWDGDGDSDADDWSGFLDMYSQHHPCTDIDRDGTIDSNDFFTYLDHFANPC